MNELSALAGSERYGTCSELVVEQSHTGEGHCNASLVTLFDNKIVTNGTAGLCDISNTALFGALDVIAEGEEGIRAEGDAVDRVEVGALLLTREGSGLLGEVLLPVAVSANVLFVLVDVTVDNVISVGSAESILKGKV